MRKLIVMTLGLVSATFGLLIHLPDHSVVARPLMVGLNELPWLPAGLGSLAAVSGVLRKPRSWFSAFLGLIGIGFSLKPLLEWNWAARDMADAMRHGLGSDYERKIPLPMQARMSPKRWSLPNTLGRRTHGLQVRLTRNLIYAETPQRTLKLDIYEPLQVQPAHGDSYPAIVVIHWGGWDSGDKGGYFVQHNRYLAGQGYVVFDIQYRLSPEIGWPAQLDDVQTAIRWVKNHAADYRLNPRRVALLGRSAGGHLALMAGYCPEDDAAQVQAVVAIYPPTDLRLWRSDANTPVPRLLGGSYQAVPEAYAAVSPVEYVRDNLPPTMVLEGFMDELVPYSHGESLANRFAATNTPFVMLRVPWGRHGFDTVMSGLGAQLTQYHVDRFLAWNLYGDHNA